MSGGRRGSERRRGAVRVVGLLLVSAVAHIAFLAAEAAAFPCARAENSNQFAYVEVCPRID